MNNRLALITGASSGIGRDIARILASQGFHLVLCAQGDSKLKHIKEELEAQYSSFFHTRVCDLSAREQALNLIPSVDALCRERNLRFTHLINNAGTGTWKRFDEASVENTLATINVNVVALSILCHSFIALAKANNTEASILNVSSMASFYSVPNYAVYSATKSYVAQLSETLAYELKGSKISVTCVHPGGTITNFAQRAGQNIRSNTGMMSSEKVARSAVRALERKKKRVVPGFPNRLFLVISSLLPRAIVTVLVRKLMATVISNMN